jgi:hypothetical protein
VYTKAVEKQEALLEEFRRVDQTAVELLVDLPALVGNDAAIDFVTKRFALQSQHYLLSQTTKPAEKAATPAATPMDTTPDNTSSILNDLQKRLADMEAKFSKQQDSNNSNNKNGAKQDNWRIKQKNVSGRGGYGKPAHHAAQRNGFPSAQSSGYKSSNRGRARSRSSDFQRSRSQTRSSRSNSRGRTDQRGRSREPGSRDHRRGGAFGRSKGRNSRDRAVWTKKSSSGRW